MRSKIQIALTLNNMLVIIAIAAIISSILFPVFAQPPAAVRISNMKEIDNVAPMYAMANDDTYAVQENQSLSVASPGVLANDIDTAGHPLAAVLVTNPSHGNLTLNADGSFTYAPEAGFLGSDTFTYQAKDIVQPSLVSNTATVTISTLTSSFVPDTGGITPRAGVTLGPGGRLYGVDSAGGPSGDGDIFTMTAGGVKTTLHAFHGADGKDPQSQLVLGGDGALYGTTLQGGPHNMGTIFRIGLDDALSVLYPYGGSDLIVGPGGELYGTTELGGANKAGSIFKIALDGSGYTTLYSFSGFGSDGGWPLAGLTRASDGNFYGTTTQSGDSSSDSTGTIFQFTPSGTLTTLHTFNGIDGCAVRARLVEGSDGNLYGTSSLGGNEDGLAGEGSLFMITKEGAFTTVHTFNYAKDGLYPIGGLTRDTDGNLYGAAAYGGMISDGTVYRLAQDGTLATLHTFDGTDGFDPWGRLTQGADGALYGTAVFGGTGIFLGGGTVYRLNLGLPAPASVAPFASNDYYTATTNESLVVAAKGVLENDTDIYGDPLTALTTSNPSGTLSFNDDGSFTYTPKVGFSGTDTFTYRATDSVHPSLVSNTATVSITVNPGPAVTVVTPASATPSPVFGTTTKVSVRGGYAGTGGAAALTYTWSSVGPGSVNFASNGTNAAASTTATFNHAGSYTLTVTITDPSNTNVTNSVHVVVNQTPASISVSPGPTLTLGPPLPASQQFTATAYDQFGHVEAPQPLLYWKLIAGSVGSIDVLGGLYHTGHASGTATVKAKTSNGVVSGSCAVTVK